MRHLVRRAWGLPGGSYKSAADALIAAGHPTNEQGFKNTLREKGLLPERAIPAHAPGICELVHALLSIWPEFEWERLVLDPAPDYLRRSANVPQVTGLESGRNPREFQTSV
jgi:hypothetical protein